MTVVIPYRFSFTNLNIGVDRMSEQILMIHGMWLGGWVWNNFEKYFKKKGYSCTAPDLPYHSIKPGQKPDPRLGNTSVMEYVDFLDKKIRKMKKKPVIIGHSFGCVITQLLATRGLAKAIVLVGPSPTYGIWCINKISVLRSFWSILYNKKWWKNPFKPTFKECRYSMLNVLTPDEQREVYGKFIPESGRAVLEIGFWFLDRKKTALADADRIHCPIYIMAGSKDRIVPLSVSRGTKKKFSGHKNCVYREYAEHSHMFMIEKGWEKLASDIDHWIRKALK